MMIPDIYRKYLLAALPAIALCGCDSSLPDIDDAAEEQDSNPRIEIYGGKPTGTEMSSRAISEPSRPGICDANMLRIWTYRGVTYTTNTPEADNMTFLSETEELPVTHYSGDNNCNKWTSHTFNCIADGARNTGYAMSSLAYNATDKETFTVTSGDKYSDLKLSLNGTSTPELYFGRLRFEAYNDKKVNQMKNAENGIFYVKNTGTKKTYNNCPVTGKLYRIVSQLNVKIDKINGHSVTKMEMYLSNIPTGMTLYGNHGAYYPVSSATTHSASGDILVSSVSDFSDGTATLSTFLLPSAEGRSLKIRVYYDQDNAGKTSYKDYEIRPSKSFFLTGDDAEVYSAGAPENLRHGTDLYVYNGTDNLFYSYSNVRVNISGDFDNVFAETTVTDVNIEVCPSFEKVHNFPIN